MKSLVCLILFLLSSQLMSASWQNNGIEFSASDESYKNNRSFLNEGSEKVSRHILYLLKEVFPASVSTIVKVKDFRIIFDSTSSVSAFFAAPGFYHENKMVIVINSGLIKDSRLDRLVSHEFFHLIHFLHNPSEEDWIKEGLAQYFEYLLHGNITYTHIEKSLTQSFFALEEKFDIAEYQPEKYGNSFLFFHYLFKNCGLSGNFWSVFDSRNKSGRSTIQHLLKQSEKNVGPCVSPNAIMGKYVLAKMINDLTEKKIITDYLIWESPSQMTSSLKIAKGLQKLTSAEIGIFFENLPSFLGIRIPFSSAHWMNAKILQKAHSEGVRFYLLTNDFPRELKGLLNFEAFSNRSDGDLIFYKER